MTFKAKVPVFGMRHSFQSNERKVGRNALFLERQSIPVTCETLPQADTGERIGDMHLHTDQNSDHHSPETLRLVVRDSKRCKHTGHKNLSERGGDIGCLEGTSS
jgi:hypothetical protein